MYTVLHAGLLLCYLKLQRTDIYWGLTFFDLKDSSSRRDVKFTVEFFCLQMFSAAVSQPCCSWTRLTDAKGTTPSPRNKHSCWVHGDRCVRSVGPSNASRGCCSWSANCRRVFLRCRRMFSGSDFYRLRIFCHPSHLNERHWLLLQIDLLWRVRMQDDGGCTELVVVQLHRRRHVLGEYLPL